MVVCLNKRGQRKGTIFTGLLIWEYSWKGWDYTSVFWGTDVGEIEDALLFDDLGGWKRGCFTVWWFGVDENEDVLLFDDLNEIENGFLLTVTLIYFNFSSYFKTSRSLFLSINFIISLFFKGFYYYLAYLKFTFSDKFLSFRNGFYEFNCCYFHILYFFLSFSAVWGYFLTPKVRDFLNGLSGVIFLALNYFFCFIICCVWDFYCK